MSVSSYIKPYSKSLLQKLTAPLNESWRYNPQISLRVTQGISIRAIRAAILFDFGAVWTNGGWINDPHLRRTESDATLFPSSNLFTLYFWKLFIPARTHCWSLLWSAVSLAAGDGSSFLRWKITGAFLPFMAGWHQVLAEAYFTLECCCSYVTFDTVTLAHILLDSPCPLALNCGINHTLSFGGCKQEAFCCCGIVLACIC